MAISRLLSLQVDAERVAMETVVGTIKSAIGIKVAESVVKQDVRGLAVLEGANPMDRLSQLPANYLGEFSNVDPHTLEDGNWYFDKRAGVLVYLVRNKGFFAGGSADPPRAKFAIRLVYTDRDANGRYDPATETIEGVNLVALESYRWLKD
jgi:general secretion pathway protein G